MRHELLTVETLNGPRGVFVVYGDADITLDADAVPGLLADRSLTHRDDQLISLVREHAGLASVWVLVGSEARCWQFADDLHEAEVDRIAYLFFRSHVPLYRALTRAGFCLNVTVGFREREVAAYTRATQRLAAALEAQRDYARSTPPHENLAELELDAWIMTRLHMFSRQPMGPEFLQFLARHLPRLEERTDRMRALVRRVDPNATRIFAPREVPREFSPPPPLPALVPSDEISVRELLLADQRDSREQARAALESRVTMLANVSHELRTPIHGILGMAETLGLDRLDADDRARVATIRRCAESLTALLDDLLDASRLEVGQLIFHERPTDLAAVVRDQLAPFALQAERAGVRFESRVEVQACALPLVDEDRLAQVVRNLVGNALKFTPPGGAVEAAAEVALTPAGRARFRFAVSDSGPGISREHQQRIFEPFFQTDAGADRKLQGAGLGLSICRRIVERMGGDLWVRSLEGVGSTFGFDVELRCQRDDSSAREFASEPDRPSRVDTLVRRIRSRLDGVASARFVVVDDDAVNRSVLSSFLAPFDAELLVAGDGYEAVEIARAGPASLIFMDCQMPGLDGYEATRQIRANEVVDGRPRAPIVAVTAHTDPILHRQALDAGADAVIVKPAGREIVLATIVDTLGLGAAAEP